MSVRADNRARFPLAARMVDDFRSVFGDDVRVTFAQNAKGEIISMQETITHNDWIEWQDWPTHVDSTVPRSKRK